MNGSKNRRPRFQSFLAAADAFRSAALDERLRIFRDFDRGHHREYVAFQALFIETASAECKAGRPEIGALMLAELRKVGGLNFKMPNSALASMRRR